MRKFDFGSNWINFSSSTLNEERIHCARIDFNDLMQGVDLSGKTFLDVGFGQGISTLIAAERGANVVALDLNYKSKEAFKLTKKWFTAEKTKNIELYVGSILGGDSYQEIERKFPEGFDVVHAWGSLHHTGRMADALASCVNFLAPGGLLAVAIYNRHWSSRFWRAIKYCYCNTNSIVQRLLVYSFIPIIWSAKVIATGKLFSKKQRGMSFFFDVVDWIGGYPYEYATIPEFLELCSLHNLELVMVRPSDVPTGCNEFILRKMVKPGQLNEKNDR